MQQAIPNSYSPTLTGYTVKLQNTNGFTVKTTQTGETLGDFRLSGTPKNTAGANWQYAVIDLSGTVTDGQAWTVRLNGTTDYTYVAGSNRDPLTLEAVAVGLAKTIEAGTPKLFQAAVKYSTVVLKNEWRSMPNTDSPYFFAPVNPNVRVTEADQVDVLNVFNGNSPSDDSATLTQNHLSGLGMGGDTVIGGARSEEASPITTSKWSTSGSAPARTRSPSSPRTPGPRASTARGQGLDQR